MPQLREAVMYSIIGIVYFAAGISFICLGAAVMVWLIEMATLAIWLIKHL